jgi:DNA-binding transcriptional MocR family regulator
LLSRDAGETLIDQIARSVAARIDDWCCAQARACRDRCRRAMVSCLPWWPATTGWSRGYLESRAAPGFFVRERSPLSNAANAPPPQRPRGAQAARKQPMDVVWLIRNMFRRCPSAVAWRRRAAARLARRRCHRERLRSVSRNASAALLNYGAPQGFLPLRLQLQRKLAELEIAAAPQQIVTTVGVTQALDLVAREFTRPGDTIFVDDPGWFLMFGSFAALGARVVGIPRLADGPDLAQLAQLAALRSAAVRDQFGAAQPDLDLAVGGQGVPGAAPGRAARLHHRRGRYLLTCIGQRCSRPRLAALDRLRRVIYLGGFSKSMAANLRVGFIAASPEWAQRLADRKMLATLTSSDIGERVVHQILSEGRYRKHLDRIRARLDATRARTVRQLERVGLQVGVAPAAGMFAWADCGRIQRMAERAMAEGVLLAPGSLFSPSQLRSTRMRLNVAAMHDPAVWKFFEREMVRGAP